MSNPNLVHVTRDWRGENLTLRQPGGLSVTVTARQAREDAELRAALRFAHSVAFVAPATILRLKNGAPVQ